jgi:glycosyltransferase involved in cell wall biosynthesis
MKTYKSAISIASNSPGTPTGYGVQAMLLAERLKKDGHDVAALSNYGLEGGASTIETKHGSIKHYPKGLSIYSADAIYPWHKDFVAGREIPNKVITLYDAWVYNEAQQLEELDFWSWTPVDHMSVPPRVLKWAQRPNVKTIAMSPFGQRQFTALGIDSTYIPHSVDTKVYKHTPTIRGLSGREFMGISEDAFLVGMIAANKANGSIHRKAFAENLLAFALFHKQNPNSYLYIHAEPSKAYGGFDLHNLAKAVGIPQEAILYADPLQLRVGYTQEDMAGIYSTLDVLLHASYGEGFGVPAIEAQACGTRVIGSNWAATPDLLGDDSFAVDGQPFWDEAQNSFFMIPLIPALVKALEEASNKRGYSQSSVEFGSQFDADVVWDKYWSPFIAENL